MLSRAVFLDLICSVLFWIMCTLGRESWSIYFSNICFNIYFVSITFYLLFSAA